jgi:ubiquinone/menaquinone biosynthesis C-methylase UbiE
MSARFQLRIQRYGWDRASGCYEELWGRQVDPARRALLDMADLQPGQRVLDIACGPGAISFEAARRVGPLGTVVGTDISEKMVEQAREFAETEGFGNASFLRCDAEAEAPSDSKFDAVLCSLGLMYAPNPGRALERMRGALRPGGRAVAAVWGARTSCGWAEIFPVVDERVESAVCPMFFQLGSGNALAVEMERAGFLSVELQRISTTLHYASDAEAVAAAFEGGPVALAASRFSQETRRSAERDYLASLASYRRGIGYAVPGEFVVARGVAAAPI